jgi:D-lactate dehydrogenase
MKTHQIQKINTKLVSLLDANRVHYDAATCHVYGYDNSRGHALPSFVLFPKHHDEIVNILTLCSAEEIPVLARGLGTNTVGASIPIHGGIVLSFEHFANIIKIDPDNRLIKVQPGVTNLAVQQAVGAHGFLWGPDPGSAAFCTVGGNLACNAAGARALKYGSTRDNTLALTAVTGTGATIHTGSQTSKNASGYDLTRLLVGSEGTLAIFTEATLKLTPKPTHSITIRACYQDVHAATTAITQLLAQATTPSTLEFLDARAVSLIQVHSELQIPKQSGAMLLMTIEGDAHSIRSLADQVAAAATVTGTIEVLLAKDDAQAAQFWQVRKALSPALRRLAPNKINEDVVVPVSELASFLEFCQQLVENHPVLLVCFGHAGNGNIHVNLLFDARIAAEAAAAKHCLTQIFEKVIEIGGCLSGEHGIGLAKKPFMHLQYSETEIAIMKGIKRVFDPKNILNPGKIF